MDFYSLTYTQTVVIMVILVIRRLEVVEDADIVVTHSSSSFQFSNHTEKKNLFQIQKNVERRSLWECDHDLDEST